MGTDIVNASSTAHELARVTRLTRLLIDRANDPRAGDTERAHAIFATSGQMARIERLRANMVAT